MATINAAISVTSDVTGYGTTINNSMTMTKAGTIAGLDQATGLVRKTLTSIDEVDLLTVGAGVVADVAVDTFSSKLYIKNVNSDSSEYFTVGLGASSTSSTKQAFSVVADATRSVEIGRLYAGDFMIIPWDAASDENDIFVKPSVATTTTIEYQVFYV